MRKLFSHMLKSVGLQALLLLFAIIATDFQINNFTAFSEYRSIIYYYTPSALTPCEINYLKICIIVLLNYTRQFQSYVLY